MSTGLAAPLAGGASTSARRTASLAIAAIGVVYGDIGTSPLYTIRESFNEAYGLTPNAPDVLGVLSLIFWSLTIVVTLKYVLFVLRADNRGEGGVMALLALAVRHVDGRTRAFLVVMGLCGAALFYGDGIITPAISVLSAVEGLEIATPQLKPYVVPLSVVVLCLLFAVQRRGTESVGGWFGPITLAWFAAIALLGFVQITQHPEVLSAVDPRYALDFGARHGMGAFVALGAIVLAVTGAEALYADIGHFGKRPIRIAWLYLVLPALLLNYFGQGALILSDPTTIRNPFYLLAPDWALYPMVALATAATIIASQAVISGAFSITRQAIQLGYLPRLAIKHTSSETIGQVYLPHVNLALLAAVVALVVGFGSSSSLANAYGIAVTGTFLTTTVLIYFVARRQWGWGALATGIVVLCFGAVDAAFLGANLIKILDGGWFPIVVGVGIFVLMTTWKKGREILLARLREESLPLAGFLARLGEHPVTRVPGTAVFMTSTADAIPHALLHNLKHNRVLHERVVILTAQIEDVPYVADDERASVRALAGNFFTLLVRYGFMETPDIPSMLAKCRSSLELDPMETSFFLGRETLIPRRRTDMAMWREKLFIRLARNALSAVEFFKIPPGRVVELGNL